MKLVKPSWVFHDGKPIFTIDIHPDGSRFATGGQSMSATPCSGGIICIWSLEPVRSETDEQVSAHQDHQDTRDQSSTLKHPRELCRLEQHNACVNCVRWAHCGRWLASCSDDRLVMVIL